MWKPEIKAKRAVGVQALEFIQEKLNDYDVQEMYEIVIKHENYDKRPYPGGRGRARAPYVYRTTGERVKGDPRKSKYRIGIFVRGYDRDLPSKHHLTQGKMPRKYGYYPWIGAVAKEVGEITVYLMGHEMYHYLCWTKQLDSDVNDEPAANKLGYEWVEEYIKWKGL